MDNDDIFFLISYADGLLYHQNLLASSGHPVKEPKKKLTHFFALSETKIPRYCPYCDSLLRLPEWIKQPNTKSFRLWLCENPSCNCKLYATGRYEYVELAHD